MSVKYYLVLWHINHHATTVLGAFNMIAILLFILANLICRIKYLMDELLIIVINSTILLNIFIIFKHIDINV